MRHAIAAGSFQPKQVVSITLPLQNLTEAEANLWQEHEILYQGKMYDVIQTHPKAGKLIVQCLCDVDENNLIASFLDTMHRSGQHPGKTAGPLEHLFSPFLLNDGCYSFGPLTGRSLPYLQKPVALSAEGFQYVPAPPPWQV